MSNPADDLAARRALISSGIVGLTTALLTKFMDVKLNVSLPVSVATAITLDYMVNRHQNRVGLEVLETEAMRYLTSLQTDGGWSSTYTDHLLFGVTSLMALNEANFVMGAYEMLPEPHYTKDLLKQDLTEFGTALLQTPESLGTLVDEHTQKIMDAGPRLLTPDSMHPAIGRVALFKGENDELMAMVFEGRTAALVPCIRFKDQTVKSLRNALASPT